jgi:dihydropyrimidinase
VRGKTVMRDGELVGRKGQGGYVARQRSAFAAPSPGLSRRTA